MAEIRNIVSESQKAAQKKYDQKTKMVSIKYTPYLVKSFFLIFQGFFSYISQMNEPR